MKPYYEHAGITIYHGDCREILPEVSADVLVTDPPYGVGYSSGWDNKFRDIRIACDEDESCRDAILTIWKGPALVFGSWKVTRPGDTRMVLIWDKGTVGMGDLSLPWFPSTEEIYVLGTSWVGSRSSAVMRYVNRNKFHPTEKPIELLMDLLSKVADGAKILDPFMGSGTTLIAAKDLHHPAIGIEIEEKYCEIAAKRLSQEVFQF